MTIFLLLFFSYKMNGRKNERNVTSGYASAIISFTRRRRRLISVARATQFNAAFRERN